MSIENDIDNLSKWFNEDIVSDIDRKALARVLGHLRYAPKTQPTVPLMDDQVLLAAHNEDPGDWNDLNFKKSWYDGFVVGFRAAESDHGIKGEPK